MAETTMGAALKRGGVNEAFSRLHTLAWDCLRAAGRNPTAALESFSNAVRTDAALVVEAIGGKQLDVALLGILKSRAADMNHNTGTGSEGHQAIDAQIGLAPASAGGRDGDKDHSPFDAHKSCVPPSRPAREPTTVERTAAVRAAKTAAKSIADSFRVGALGGQLLGDIAPSSYERMIFAAGRERFLGRLLKAWRDHKAAHIPSTARTRDIVPEKILVRMVAFAKYTTTHGIEFIDDSVLLEQMEQSDAV